MLKQQSYFPSEWPESRWDGTFPGTTQALVPPRTFLALVFLVFCACSSIAATSSVARIKPQEITSIETADTILERDELVYSRDEANSGSGIALRIGDGATPGGTIVSDVFALRTPFLRQLRRDEYQITTFGNVTFSNSAWEMITRRSASSASAANTGTLVISSSYPIAEVLGTFVHNAATWDGDDLNARTYTIKTNYSFTIAEKSGLYPDVVNFQASIANMSVWAWVGAGMLGKTNDARCSTLLVGDPEIDDAAISRGWFLSSMATHRGDDWSTYAATTTVDAAWQPIRHNPFLTCVSTGNAGNLVWQRRYASGTTRDLMTLSSTNRNFAMIAYAQGSTSVVVQIEASCPFASAPVIQVCTNLPGQVWSNLTTLSTWPTTTWRRATSGALLYPVFELSAIINQTNQGFYRVSATATNTDLDALMLSVPLVLLPTYDTNAPSIGATVYTGAEGKLWTVNSAGSRLCLSDASSSGGSTNGVTYVFGMTNQPAGTVWTNGVTVLVGTNQTGATGPQGPAGPAGTNGATGATGATGPQGPAGTNGVTGATGATGPQGPAGTNGVTGATGATGPQGPAGTNGATGATGATGPQGPAGTNGATGATGATGPQGPAGTNGVTGATGSTGPQGPAGTNGATGATGATGPQGPAGTNGAAAYVQITNVVTLAAGSSAWASNNIVGSTNNVTLGIPQGAQGAAGGGIDAPTATNIATTVVSGMRTAYYLTNTVTVTNGGNYTISGLPSSVCYIDEIDAWLSNTNEGARAFSSSLQIFNSPDMLADSMVHSEWTNRSWWAAPLTVASAVGAMSNVVADASGVTPGTRYVITDGLLYEFKFCASNNATTLFWGRANCSGPCSTNKLAWSANGTKISKLNAVGQFVYATSDASSNLYWSTAFNAPGTNTITKLLKARKFGN